MHVNRTRYTSSNSKSVTLFLLYYKNGMCARALYFVVCIYHKHNRMDCAEKEKRDVEIEQVRQQYICGFHGRKNNLMLSSMNKIMIT